MSFAVGSLVRARGREWVVIGGSDDDLVLLRPLSSTDEEATGVLASLERIEEARFDWPEPDDLGDHRSARMLRDALRLSVRSSAGPFRCFGRISVEPRPYQLVPLLMALRLDPVRLLIADDVGVGKSVEAGLVARELLSSGAAASMAVLCPPHLAEQWQAELYEKFHLDAEVVLASTATRLERGLPPGVSLFERERFVVVSTDFIKSDRRRDEFLRTCPPLVIVDEAHTCAAGATRGRHQRHQLVAGLASDPARHLLLVTATPHSGNEEAFRSLLCLLDPTMGPTLDNSDSDNGNVRERARARLARHLVQRRRADLATYLGDTPFPEREEADETYRLSADQGHLLSRALEYARASTREETGGHARRRVRWWSALGLLRAMSSSPAAAVATLRARSSASEAETIEEIDALGVQEVLDPGDEEAAEPYDVTPGADLMDSAREVAGELGAMAEAAAALAGARDTKIARLTQITRNLLSDGFSPIVFCRFIETALYVAEQLRGETDGEVAVSAVTGRSTPEERESLVAALSQAAKRVLVATDCLSEGINLQESFDAVVHYDLAWNPTRHEQREGRVDRYGQPSKVVRTVTLHGADNPVDEAVLEVLIRKQRAIRHRLGVFIPVPGSTEQLVEAMFESVLSGGRRGQERLNLELGKVPEIVEEGVAWEAVAERERTSRTRFAQSSIKVDEVASEARAVRDAIGSAEDTARFVARAVPALGGWVRGDGSTAEGRALEMSIRDCPPLVRESLTSSLSSRGSGTGGDEVYSCRFCGPAGKGEVLLGRTHPFVETLATYILESALDPASESPAKRTGVTRTGDVSRRTTLLVLRHRYELVTGKAGASRSLLAEEAGVLAFEGPPEDPSWLDEETAWRLLEAEPAANVDPAQARQFVEKVVVAREHLEEPIRKEAARRAEAALHAHWRVRAGAGSRAGRGDVRAHTPDVVGIYVLLPMVS